MQLKTLLPSLLLLALPEAAFAEKEDTATIPQAVPARYVRVSQVGVTKRNPFMLNMQPIYKAMVAGANPLVKRQQTCPAGSNKCYTGCCNLGTVCGIYGGEEGCCPIGKRCGGVSGCQNTSDVDCTTYCCPSGSVCTTDSSGEGACATSGDTEDPGNDPGSVCGGLEGYSPCAEFDGCCPTGTACKPPKNCDISCQPDDPPCGQGCCSKGFLCTSDLTCALDNSGDFTSLVPSSTIRVPSTRTSTPDDPETTDSIETSTEETSAETTSESSTDIGGDALGDSTSITTIEDSTTTTTTTRRTITTATITVTPNAAPTMGAMFGGGLGMAAGVLGVLAM